MSPARKTTSTPDVLPDDERPIPTLVQPAVTFDQLPAVMQQITTAMDDLDRYKLIDDETRPTDDLDNIPVLLANVRADIATLASCVRALAKAIA